jgi:putative glutamine amidotransferase
MPECAMIPLAGLTTCAVMDGDVKRHQTPARYAEALIDCARVAPVMIPPVREAAMAILDRIDGLLLTGSPSNVEPAHYGIAEDETPDWHDADRDATTLPMIRAAIARGIPVLAICRGIQELNVALGGTLHQQVHQMEGRRDHRGDDNSAALRYAPAHAVTLSGELARIIGHASIIVNSSHGQAVANPAPNLIVEAVAEDGTIEGVRVRGAAGFAIGVQWHPEYQAAANPDSVALFTAFGEACRAYAARARVLAA